MCSQHTFEEKFQHFGNLLSHKEMDEETTISWLIGNWKTKRAWLCPKVRNSQRGMIGVWIIGDSKLTISVNVREWLFVCVCWPCDTLAICPGWTPPLAQSQLGLAPAPPRPLMDKAEIDNGWIVLTVINILWCDFFLIYNHKKKLNRSIVSSWGMFPVQAWPSSNL